MSTHSWLKSPATVRHFRRRSLARLSLTKSMLQTSLTVRAICSGTRSDAGLLIFLRLRTVSLAALYKRYKRLWTPEYAGRSRSWMRRLFRPAVPRSSHQLDPDFALLHREPKRTGVTLQLLWEEVRPRSR